MNPRTHIPALDGIRGLAILLVLWHHCYLQPGSPLYHLNRAAWIGVDLFFVLSGFLITGILFDSLGRHDYFRRFYRRRSLRIFPLYFGVLLGLLALTIPLGLHWHGRQWLLLAYLQNVGLIEPFHFDISNWVTLNHFWSLSIEEQYYLVWPLVIYFVGDKIKLVWISLGLSAAALALRCYLAQHVNAAYVFTATPTRADALLLGSALALVMRSYWRWIVRRFALPAFAVTSLGMVALGLMAHGFDWWTRPVETIGFTLSALCGVSLIGMCLQEGSWTERLFRNSVLRFFGRYSYGLYVWHAFLYAGLRARLAGHLGTFFGDLLCITLSVLVALASYHGFEKWFLQMKDSNPRAAEQLKPALVASE